MVLLTLTHFYDIMCVLELISARKMSKEEIFMKKLICLILATVLIMTFSACGKASLIGIWDCYAKTNNKGEMEDITNIVFEFTDDGRLIITDNGSTDIGSYTFDDDKIYSSKGEYTKNWGVKKLDNDNLVIYKLDNPVFEYYFTRR